VWWCVLLLNEGVLVCNDAHVLVLCQFHLIFVSPVSLSVGRPHSTELVAWQGRMGVYMDGKVCDVRI